MADHFVLGVFPVDIDSEVVLLGVDLAGSLALLDEISDALEVKKEEEELPDHPNGDGDDCDGREGDHGLAVLELAVTLDMEVIDVDEDDELDGQIASLD